MTRRIRIGAVDYLNTRPLVFGMEQGLGAQRIALSYAVPSVLADQMREGQLDIGLLPVIELARSPELEVVPGLGIVTYGPSRSVLLVARRPVEQVESVALDPESRTSNALARVLLAEAWRRQPRFTTGRASLLEDLRECDATVRIGDKALFEPAPQNCHVYDLGRVWTERTGLPFVFAAWIARPGVVDREIYRVLHESRRQGAKVIDRIAEDYTWNGNRQAELSRDYLHQAIRYRLGSTEIDAMRLFFQLAARAGVVDRVPEIALAFGANSGCHEAVERQRLQAPSDEVGHG